LIISPVVGEANLVPDERTYHLSFRGIVEPEEIEILKTDSQINAAAKYNSKLETLDFEPVILAANEKLTVTIKGDLMASRDRRKEKLNRYLYQFRLDTREKLRIADEWQQIIDGNVSLLHYAHLTEAQIKVLEDLVSSGIQF
jgi:hypothetical protein